MIPKSEIYRKQKAQAEAELAQCNHQIERLQNRIHYCSDTSRKERAHHLITRGAAVESIAPRVKALDDVAFYNLAAKIFALPDVNALVDAAVAAHSAAERTGG